MTATSIRLRRHKGFKNFQNSEAHNAVNAEAGSVDQTEPPVEEVDSNLTGTPSQEEQDAEREAAEKAEREAAEKAAADAADEERLKSEADAADAALDKPGRNESKEKWTTYVDALHTKPEGYSKDLSRDQIADLVLGPKA
ncbi:hypothetical protein [Curtobacterium phage Parvaparticeps]|nr:hypothetical protein [Curtobacterium phage Parvaparticeps]